MAINPRVHTSLWRLATRNSSRLEELAAGKDGLCRWALQTAPRRVVLRPRVCLGRIWATCEAMERAGRWRRRRRRRRLGVWLVGAGAETAVNRGGAQNVQRVVAVTATLAAKRRSLFRRSRTSGRPAEFSGQHGRCVHCRGDTCAVDAMQILS